MQDIFSGRSKDYVKFRAGYSEKLKKFMARHMAIKNNLVIADVGSGTGLLAQILVELGPKVFGVEPNDDMRKEGETKLAMFRNFISVCGNAEKTNLANNSIDIITAGNAFHWFDPVKAKKEFQRILKPAGKILLVRTDWKKIASQKMKEYDRIICKYCVGRDGSVSNPALQREIIKNFFSCYDEIDLGKSTIKYNREELKGRFLSTSFSPKPGHDQYENAMKELDMLFDDFESNGKFLFELKTTVICGNF